MHIKKLEIAGFKSFVDRTVIHFDHDVIGIVGPNGCGKSNIVDALRWGMGEQSAKHLRGRSMEDVIFSGSESRKPHGLAEVTLTFDNSDAGQASSLPEEYRNLTEIAITRRLFRDGNSEYRINRVAVRLRDITDLFLGTGVGTKAYSIVEQGRIGQIVSARPQDRRAFIEEAAGTTKYRQRRRQSERKMELSRQNLVRLNDIISEIDRNRSSLRRQAAKAERFLRYREESERHALHQASHSFLELMVTRNFALSEQARNDSEATQLRLVVGEGVERFEAERRRTAAAEKQSDEATAGAHQSEGRLSALMAEQDQGRQRVEHLKERLGSARALRGELEARVDRLRGERAGLEERLTELNAAHKRHSEDSKLQALRHQALADASRASDVELRQRRQRAAELSSRIAADEAKLESLQQRTAAAAERGAGLSAQREHLRGQLEAAEQRARDLRPAAEEAERARASAASRSAELKRDLQGLTGQLKPHEHRVREARRQADQCRSRLTVVEEMQRRGEGLRSAARPLIASGEASVKGLATDLFRVPESLTLALATFLGDDQEALLANDSARALELLRNARERKQGRLALLSTTVAFAAGGGDRVEQLLGEEKVVGLARRLVEHDSRDAPVVQALLGDLTVVEDAETAVRIRERYCVPTVSLDGIVAQPNGLVRGGSQGASPINRKLEIRSLRRNLAAREAELQTAEASFEELTTRHGAAQVELEKAQEAVRAGELRALAARKDSQQAEAQTKGLQRQLEMLDQERARLQQACEREAEETASAQARLTESRELIDQARAALAEGESATEECRAQLAEHATVVTEQRVRLARVTEQLESVRGALVRVDEALAATEREAKALEKGAADAEVETTTLLSKLAATERQVEGAREARKQAQEALTEARGQLEASRKRVAEREAELAKERGRLADAEGRLRQGELSLQKLELDQQHLLASVRERFRGLELPSVLGTYHALAQPSEADRKRLVELGGLIERIGPINLEARAEYAEAERRFEELTSQREDVEKALAELEQTVRHIDRESKRRLLETFKSVNELFGQMFQRMFKGGQAKLTLTDPNEILESGVEIMAQPPGKKLGTVELMSGGEKALTATSLIFAIFQHRPSPFCVLDEVDAPLDEANVSRYNDAVRSMTDRSQFIVITHIKKTMQAVDLLYGVTMAEPGVSRMVSVKVNEHARPRPHAREEHGARPPRSVSSAPAEQAAKEETQVA